MSSIHNHMSYARNEQNAMIARYVGVAVKGLVKLATSLKVIVKSWNEARATKAVLANLSDEQLKDIGLNRNDVDSYIARKFNS